MSPRLRGWLLATSVMLVTGALVIADVADAGMRRWWDTHALTTSTVSGLLVLAVTLLIVDQVVRLRQTRDRARAVAAQAAILVGQGVRATQALSAALRGSGDRSAASDEFRTYMMMLLVGAPLLIDERTARNFLERAQFLGAEMAKAITAESHPKGKGTFDLGRLDRAVQLLRDASAPLISVLDSETQVVVRGEEDTAVAGTPA